MTACDHHQTGMIHPGHFQMPAKKTLIQPVLTAAPRRVVMVLIAVTVCTVPGCANKTAQDQTPSSATTASPAALRPDAQAEVTTEPAAPTTTAATEEPSAAPAPRAGHAIDAMIGQVNGKAIYANNAFEAIEDQLIALGRSLPPTEFRQRAAELIVGRLQQLVTDALILGEAERDLSAPEQAGLFQYLKQQREELIRFWGRGSIAVAEDNLVRHTSRSLDETLQDTREQMLVQRYLRQELFPQINVSRKQIERYYHDHKDTYAPPASRTIRLIRVKDPEIADRVDRILAKGKPFAEVAARSFNLYHADEGGLMSERAVGDEVFGEEGLNQAMLALQPGEHSPRQQALGGYAWVYVETIDRETHRSLRDAQLEIDSILRRQQFQALTERYRRELYETGSYNSIESMSLALIEIAMNRYSTAE